MVGLTGAAAVATGAADAAAGFGWLVVWQAATNVVRLHMSANATIILCLFLTSIMLLLPNNLQQIVKYDPLFNAIREDRTVLPSFLRNLLGLARGLQ
jgi:hypothetical protein